MSKGLWLILLLVCLLHLLSGCGAGNNGADRTEAQLELANQDLKSYRATHVKLLSQGFDLGATSFSSRSRAIEDMDPQQLAAFDSELTECSERISRILAALENPEIKPEVTDKDATKKSLQQAKANAEEFLFLIHKEQAFNQNESWDRPPKTTDAYLKGEEVDSDFWQAVTRSEGEFKIFRTNHETEFVNASKSGIPEFVRTLSETQVNKLSLEIQIANRAARILIVGKRLQNKRSEAKDVFYFQKLMAAIYFELSTGKDLQTKR